MLKTILIWIIIFDCAIAQQIIVDDSKKTPHVQGSSVELTNSSFEVANYSEQSAITDISNRFKKVERIEYEKYNNLNSFSRLHLFQQ